MKNLLKKIGVGLGGLIVMAVIIACGGGVGNDETAVEDRTATQEERESVQAVLEAAQTYFVAQLTAWGLDSVEAACVARAWEVDGSVEEQAERLTDLDLLNAIDDISPDGSLLPQEIVALPSWLECVG